MQPNTRTRYKMGIQTTKVKFLLGILEKIHVGSGY